MSRNLKLLLIISLLVLSYSCGSKESSKEKAISDTTSVEEKKAVPEDESKIASEADDANVKSIPEGKAEYEGQEEH